MERNLSCWKKCGAVPLTRAPLVRRDPKVRHEVPTGRAADIASQQEEDPAVTHLRNIENMNHFHCDYLSANGYDGSQLRRDAPKRATFVAVTQPHSKERIQAIKKARTAGQMFFATGGSHLNSNEFFQAKALEVCDEELKQMQQKKKARDKYCKIQLAAIKLLKQKGELTLDNEKKYNNKEIETMLGWKKVKASSKKKQDMIQAYVDAPKPKPQKIWCNSEAAALKALESDEVNLKDTALGVAAQQMARAVTNNLAKLDTPTRNSLKRRLEEYDEDNQPNCL
jgi:hypothetical protein